MLQPKHDIKFIELCIQYSSLTLVYYDYILTLPSEIKNIWFSPFRLTTALYFFCRYSLIANVVYALAVNGRFPLSCDTAYKVSSALSVLGRAAIVVVWGMRTYAVFSGSRVIVVIFGPLGLSVVILAAMHVPNVSCSGKCNDTIATDLLSAITVVFEVLLTACSTLRAVQAIKIGGSWKEQRDGLMFMILEQGLLYFVFVTGFTATALVLNYTEPNGSFSKRLLNSFTIPISGIMTARFVLHLRQWDKEHTNVATTNNEPDQEVMRSAGVIRFASGRSSDETVISEFGEDPVRFGRREVLSEDC
ncbi:hypothetical protein BDQ17DRAFT_1355104 [Cyathus striatus]|nr:hypothetical protein BDQ17DRAFT_1355104 [Cyathus striatus]